MKNPQAVSRQATKPLHTQRGIQYVIAYRQLGSLVEDVSIIYIILT